MGDQTELDDFYEALKNGVSVDTFLRRYDEIFPIIHKLGFTEDYRLGRGKLKCLSDEITPVARFCRFHTRVHDKICFALDETYPDCIIEFDNGRRLEVEVTVANALKRKNLMTELNNSGKGRGFINVHEDAPHQDFLNSMEAEPKAYSTDEVIECVRHDLLLRAERKKFHQGDTLLVELDLVILPSCRWQEHLATFSREVESLSFENIFLTGRGSRGDLCMRIK